MHSFAEKLNLEFQNLWKRITLSIFYISLPFYKIFGDPIIKHRCFFVTKI